MDISKICHRKLVEFLDPVVIYTSLRNVSGLLHKLTHIKMHTGEFMAGMEMLWLCCVLFLLVPIHCLKSNCISIHYSNMYFKIFKFPPIIFFFRISLLLASLHPSSLKKKENKECRKIISKPKIHRIFIESRNYTGQGRNQESFSTARLQRVLFHLIMPLYIYVFYRSSWQWYAIR